MHVRWGFIQGDLTADKPLFDALAAVSVRESVCAFEKITAAAGLWEAWFERDAECGGDLIYDCGNNAVAEMALRLGCSRTVAENFALLGVDLRLRLPLTRAAFACGELDYARVAKISRLTGWFKAETVAEAEAEIVAAARGLSPGPLASVIDQILIRIAPGEVAKNRVDATMFRRVRKRRDGDLAVFDATLSPEECEATWQRIAEVADTVCKYDRRNRQYRLVDAFQALIHGENRLQCRCERADCVAREKVSDKRRTPLVQVSIDVATLLGLLSNPAYLEGYGPIDPDLARELAKNGTWQTMLTEALDMARKLGLVEPEAEPEPEVEEPQPEPEPEPERQPVKRPRACFAVFRARGTRRKAGWLPEFGSTPVLSDPAPSELSPHRVAELVAQALADNPAGPG